MATGQDGKESPRAAQKLNLSSSPHRRRRSGDENIGPEEQPIFPNGYAALLLKSPPPAPPALLRRIGVKELTGVGKVSFTSIYSIDDEPEKKEQHPLENSLLLSCCR
ncbi:hypothetical protein KPH14_003224 [Odynerus spinipes]|uniref:Uncharacterized protein n=1 Tax=Odynerus spinipes TaxID=1348599 RepID=A0AAD9R8Q1_9HYME|nr:hypothetical protein KPH14_003224 [Odynerus spinipes]